MKDTIKARQAFEKALELDPNSVVSHMHAPSARQNNTRHAHACATCGMVAECSVSVGVAASLSPQPIANGSRHTLLQCADTCTIHIHVCIIHIHVRVHVCTYILYHTCFQNDGSSSCVSTIARKHCT